ncbi:MAG: hypothetical protein WC059_03395 [Candidatus Paceibacterota bacterium]
MIYKRDSLQILKLVSDAIVKKYDPKGEKIFSFAFVNKISGKILSPKIAILTGKTGEHDNEDVLYIVHPEYLDNYHPPLAALTITTYGKAGASSSFYYPEGDLNPELQEIILLIKKTLKDANEWYAHQTNWL